MAKYLKDRPIVVSIIVILCSMLNVASDHAKSHTGKEAFQTQFQRKAQVMGFDCYVHLFNLRVYKEKVLPAYHVFFEKGATEPLIALVKECLQILASDPQLSEQLLWSKESCEADIGILTGSVYYNSKGNPHSGQGKKSTTLKDKQIFVRGLLSSNILQVLCVPRNMGANPTQNMGRTSLIPYLYDRSEWIKDLFTSVRQVRGGALELSIGEGGELFTKTDIHEFREHLSKVPPPELPLLRKEYDNLHKLLKLAWEDSDLTLILSVM